MRVTCAVHGTVLDLEAPPRRVASFVSSATETLAALGCSDALVGVTPYCRRYVPDLAAPVVGDYLQADLPALAALAPDLVLVTSGVQGALGRRLARAGLPVFALPLPASRFGILENQLALGGLMHRAREARELCDHMARGFQELEYRASATRPTVWTELWFGPHLRGIGPLSFVHDLVRLAGGEPVGAPPTGAYPRPDLAAVPPLRPDVVLLFQEPEYPVDGGALVAERGWDWGPRLVAADVARGRNPIHDGPSFLETARWLRDEFLTPAD